MSRIIGTIVGAILAIWLIVSVASGLVATIKAFVIIGLIAVGQLALAAALSGVTLANVSTPASSFGTSAPAGSLDEVIVTASRRS